MNVPFRSGDLAALQASLRHALDPVAFTDEVLDFHPDRWQRHLLRTLSKPALVCCSRQSGKSTTAAALALHCVIHQPGALVLMLAPTQRQSTELLAKASSFLRKIPGAQLDNESSVAIKFSDGARLVSLPGTDPDRIRGFSAPAVVIIDEAAFVSDQLYYAIRPMLAVGGGRLIAMSTPNGRQGWFFDAWANDRPEDWLREKVTAYEVPRITKTFLDAERRRIGDRWFRQEYLCEFISADDQLFDAEDIARAFDDNVQVLGVRSGL